jgi:hypothetical protein
MNRLQFFVLTGLSSLVVLLLIGHILLGRQTGFEQNRLAAAQQAINRGQSLQGNLQRLAGRIYNDGKTDPALRDLLVREQIKVNPGPEAPAPAPAESPAPSSTPLTH